jgi:hypothetical protein
LYPNRIIDTSKALPLDTLGAVSQRNLPTCSFTFTEPADPSDFDNVPVGAWWRVGKSKAPLHFDLEAQINIVATQFQHQRLLVRNKPVKLLGFITRDSIA